MSKRRIFLYDSTLRDGGQTSMVNFTANDKREIAVMLDKLSIDYIEGGWPGSNITDDIFFKNLPKLNNSKFTAFGMTGRSKVSVNDDKSLNNLVKSNVDSICIVGKTWDLHLSKALNITKKKNLLMIKDSIEYIAKHNKEPLFDAEHFFDGYKEDKEYALECIKTAYKSGARWVVLCDTNGGSLPNEVYEVVKNVTNVIPEENLAIHCHNDTDNAVANSLEAVRAGVCQIQGTINGIGERCGNANLISLIPTLMLKLNYDVGISKSELKNLTIVSNFVNEITNIDKSLFLPYTGKFAFAHKGGLHVSAMSKTTRSYEHIDPSLVGNKRKIIISDQAGKSNIIDGLKRMNLDYNIQDNEITDLVNKVKELESKGYSYDEADGSFEILVTRLLKILPIFFELINFKILNERKIESQKNVESVSQATVKISINDKIILTVAEGNGPINALYLALREALIPQYPILRTINLMDYKVKIVTPSDGTEAITRVRIKFIDDKNNDWSTIGVSTNIINASYQALCDAINYKLYKNLSCKK